MAKAEKLVPVRYVGNKPFAIDNVARSGKHWRGRGSVQKVTETQAKRLCQYPDQWQIDDGSPLPTEEQRAAAVRALSVESTARGPERIENMSAAELVAHAERTLGLTLNPALPRKQLLAAILEREENNTLDDRFKRNRAVQEA